MTDDVISRIRNAVYGADADGLCTKRLRLLYGVLFDSIAPEKLDEAVEEVISCERQIRAADPNIDKAYAEPDMETVIRGYSAAAYMLAEMRYKSGKPSSAAETLLIIYEELVKMPGFGEIADRMKLRRLVSETMMDLSYASGRTDNMSIRMYTSTI